MASNSLQMKEMITYLVIIAVLFLVVVKITQRNIKKTGMRKSGNFKTRYQKRKKDLNQNHTK